jgi:hypothetical protein
MRVGWHAGARGDWRSRIPWILIIGVLLALAEALFAIRILLQEPIYAVITALLIVVLTLQIDHIDRIKDAIERSRSDAVFLQKLEQAPWAKDLIEEVVDCVAAIDATKDDNDVFRRSARRELEGCSAHIGELAGGRIQPDPGLAYRLLINLVDKVGAEGTIKAVAISNPQNKFSWWDTRLGREYWQCNKNALARKVVIERVFVFQQEVSEKDLLYSQDQTLKEARRLLTMQNEEGVRVYAVNAARLPPNLRIDLVIFDGDFVYEMWLDADGEPLQYRCSHNLFDIRKRNDDYEIIKAAATQLEIDRFAKIARVYGLAENDNKVVVDSTHALRFWEHCFTGSREWLGVSYTPPDQSWYVPFAGPRASVQKEVIRAGGTIKRVFILENEDERNQLQQVMEDQERMGIEVRWMLKERLLHILQNPADSDNQEILRALDFAVVDDSWVYRNYRDKSGRLDRSEAIKDMEVTEKSRFIFYKAFREGNPP